MTNNEPDNSVAAVEPNRIMRLLIGVETKLNEIFTPQRIADCQATIDTARNSFFDVAGEYLAVLDALLSKHASDAEIGVAVFDDLAVLAADVKGQADAFGFALVSAICNHIIEYCEPGAHAPNTRFRIISVLAELLKIAIHQKITDDNGALAKELRASLKKY